jgi:hypothetical protein
MNKLLWKSGREGSSFIVDLIKAMCTELHINWGIPPQDSMKEVSYIISVPDNKVS